MRVVLVVVGLAALVAAEPWQEAWEAQEEEAIAEDDEQVEEPKPRIRREVYEEEPYVEYVRVRRRACCDEEPLYRRARRQPRQVHQYEVHEELDDPGAFPAPPYEEMLAASAEHYHRVASAPGAPSSARYINPDVSPHPPRVVPSYASFPQAPNTANTQTSRGQRLLSPVQPPRTKAQPGQVWHQNQQHQVPWNPIQNQYVANQGQFEYLPKQPLPVPQQVPVAQKLVSVPKASPVNNASPFINPVHVNFAPLNTGPKATPVQASPIGDAVNFAPINVVPVSNVSPSVNPVPVNFAAPNVKVDAFAPVNVASQVPLGEEAVDQASAGAGHAHAQHAQKKHAHGHHAGGGHHKHAGHHKTHGGKSVKGFSTHQHVDKGSKGHKTDEHHKKQFEEESGGKKKHHDQAEHKGGHEEEAHGHRGAHFDEKKGHKKGHKTKGYHNKYHKDEFHKEHKFYDDFHKSGEHHRYGKFHAKHASDESGKKKAHHINAGHDFVERGKKGYSNKGHLDADHKGHKGKHGHEEHHEHHENHGKKGGAEGGKEWGYQKKN